jgi:hypothetical protein
MSKNALAEFLKEVARDPDLQKEVATLAAKHGYDFRPDELSEADLSGISGGLLALDTDYLSKKPGKKS